MVAERLLDLRLLDFTSQLSAMASPAFADVFLDPPMRTFGDTTLQDYLNMGAAGALMLQAVMVAGGRVVLGIYNKVTKKPQVIYNENGEMIDFPAQVRPPRPQRRFRTPPHHTPTHPTQPY